MSSAKITLPADPIDGHEITWFRVETDVVVTYHATYTAQVGSPVWLDGVEVWRGVWSLHANGARLCRVYDWTGVRDWIDPGRHETFATRREAESYLLQVFERRRHDAECVVATLTARIADLRTHLATPDPKESP